MNQFNSKAIFLDSILEELLDINFHLSNDRPFEAGVRLGGLMNFLCTELEKSLNEENEDEEIQDEKVDEKCEESSKKKNS